MQRKDFRELSFSQKRLRIKAKRELCSTSEDVDVRSPKKTKTSPINKTSEVHNVENNIVAVRGTSISSSAINKGIIDIAENPILQKQLEENKCENNPTSDIEIRHKLQKWKQTFNVSLAAVNSLLEILSNSENLNLPKDARSLLKTPRNASINISKGNGGEYVHFGIEEPLAKSISFYYKNNAPQSVKININIDGLPLFHNSSSQFWPILGSICTNFITKPFVIGVFHGKKKPVDVNVFLKPFVNNSQEIIAKGLTVNSKRVIVTLNAFIFDAPARAFVTGVKGHNAYFGCSKCCQEGDFCENRVIYPEVNCNLRTDEDFLIKKDENYHRHDSLLESLGIGMVSQVPLDYMHLICLGVVKKILKFWVFGAKHNKTIRLHKSIIEQISWRLEEVSSSIPMEFARKPRKLNDIDKWKATELRQFLLYSSPIILKGLIENDKYVHFMALSMATRIFCEKQYYNFFYSYGKDLMVWFVQTFPDLYGRKHMSYNVHNLIHIVDDTKLHGTFDEFSAFKYENYLYHIKNKIKPSGLPLHQLHNRIREEDITSFKEISNTFVDKPQIITDNNGQIYKLQFPAYTITKKRPNNIIVLNNNQIGEVENIISKDLIEIKLFKNVTSFFLQPCDSKTFGLFKIADYCTESLTLINVRNIETKCTLLKVSQDCVILKLMKTY